MMIPDRAPEKVTIEDLLRVKRAERPSPEFWTRFETDLRAKQLAAIVEKRPWWHALHLPQAARVVLRHQMPVGAAAILVLTFVVVNQYRTGMASGSLTASDVSASVPSVAVIQPAITNVTVQAALVASASVAEAPVVKAESSTDAMVSTVIPTELAMSSISAPSRSAELTSMIPWGVGPTEDAAISTRLLKTNLEVAALAEDATGAFLLGNVRADDDRVQASQPQVAEVKSAVQQVSSPRELRRAKVLAGLVLADNAEGGDYAKAIHGRDIAANDLSDAQLYDSVHRLGMGGDRFTLKF